MRLQCKKILAVVCALAMLVSVFPMQTMAAVQQPKFAKSYPAFYENGNNQGVYTYTVKNLSKGQKVKWSVSGTGKAYAALAKAVTNVTKTSVTNKLTISTDGDSAVKNKKIAVIAKVYAKNGKLQNTLKTKSTPLKVMPTGISIVDNGMSETKLTVGKTYQFQYQITPANATSTNIWTATNSNGNLVDCMTRSGTFTPDKDGVYTINVQAKMGSQVVKEDHMTVIVAVSMTGIVQTAANTVVLQYSGDAKNVVSKDNFMIRNAAGVKMEIKDAEFSGDGTQVTLTTYNLFKDHAVYHVTDGQTTYDMTASVGKPVSLKVLTEQVTVEKETPVEYALYDANGIDVKAAYPGKITYAENITNGYRTRDDKIYMTSVGSTGMITLTYSCTADPNLVLSGTGNFVCVAANISENTNLTLTKTAADPDYRAAGYKDNRSVASGSNYYAHFRALDTDNSEIKYESIKFESSDPDTLIVNNGQNGTATVTAIKTGTAGIIVTATYAKKEYTYVYDITITEPSYLYSISADEQQIVASNVSASGYQKYVNISGKDQYGQDLALEKETALITDNNTTKTPMVSYDTASNRLLINAAGRVAGTYYYTLILEMNGHKASTNIAITVQTPPYNAASTYRVEMSRPTIDMAVSASDKGQDLVADKSTTVKVAEYRGGVFYGYVDIVSAKITKDGLNYGLDFTKGGSAAEAAIAGGKQLTVSAVALNNNLLTKAQTGVYTLELRFYQSDANKTVTSVTGYLELKDSQADPQITVDHTVSSVICKNALELAADCLRVQGSNGVIVACNVTGADVTGADYTITSGQFVNIKSVTVQVTTTLSDKTNVVSNYQIAVERTLQNK